MIPFPHRRALRSQPYRPIQINWSHPLARGLQFAAIPVGNTVYDAVTGQLASRSDAAATFTRNARIVRNLSVADYDLACDENGHLAFPVGATKLDKIAGALTVFVQGRPALNTVVAHLLSSSESSNGDGFWFFFDDASHMTNGFGISTFSGSSTPSSWDPLGANSETEEHRCMVSIDGTNARFYASGKLWETKAYSNLPPANANRRTRIYGLYSTSGTSGDPSALSLALVWDRVLSLEEYRSLYADAWQLFFQPARRPWIQTAAGGGDVTAALTGQAATTSAGTLTPSLAKALSGASIGIASGSLTPTLSIALSGLAASFAQGAVTPSTGVTVALTGQAASFAAGSLTPALSKALSGIAGTFATGTVTPSSGVVVALSGQAMTLAGGALVPALTGAISGLAQTLVQGVLTAAPSLGLTTQSLAAVAGSVAPTLTIGLPGGAVLVLQGTLSLEGEADVRMRFVARIEHKVFTAPIENSSFKAH